MGYTQGYVGLTGSIIRSLETILYFVMSLSTVYLSTEWNIRSDKFFLKWVSAVQNIMLLNN